MIKTWREDMTEKEFIDLAYWERNMLALWFADGWYDDYIESDEEIGFNWDLDRPWYRPKPRYPGWRRVLSLEGGIITFHIPYEFDVGSLPRIAANWDGHTTEEKWQRVARLRGIEV